MTQTEPILLLTKLNRPRLPYDLVKRSRLVEKFERDIDQGLVLVCAPAGLGKTTLVSEWLEGRSEIKGGQRSDLPSAWLSLDETLHYLDYSHFALLVFWNPTPAGQWLH